VNELLRQLYELIAAAEVDRGDAERWRTLVALLVERGYGPRIGPEDIAGLTPDVPAIMAVVVATQEVAAAPEESKSGKRPGMRRLLTADDESFIEAGRRQGFDATQMAAERGVTRSSVQKYLDERRGRGGE
jgi:hypothetical protein